MTLTRQLHKAFLPVWKGKNLWGLLVAFAILVVGCASPATQQDISTQATPVPTEIPSQRGIGGTLRFLNPQAPDILNPHLTVSLKNTEVIRITYEPLASVNADGELVPILAAEIPSSSNGGIAEDGTSVTWKLRQDVLWSDGVKFSADDVVFTYQFISNPLVKAATAGTYSTVASVEKIDEFTVKVNFKTVTPAWATAFVGMPGAILPKHVFEAYNGENAREAPANILPIGTGPYRVVAPGIKRQEVFFFGNSVLPTNKIVFEPNPYFREKDKPYYSKVEWRGGGTLNEAARLVFEVDRSQDIDQIALVAYGLGSLTPDKLAALDENSPSGRLEIIYGSIVERILLNRTDPNRETADGERSSLEIPHPFFSDKLVRQAFAHAINRDAIAALYGPLGRTTSNNLVAPPQFNSPNQFYNYDLNEARRLLDEAGWTDSNGDGVRDKDGTKMKVVYQTPLGALYQQTQEIVKQDLEAIGVEVELKLVDTQVMFGAGAANPDSAFRFNADMQEFDVRSSNPDPSSYMGFWQSTRIPQKSNNWATALNMERWVSPAYDELYAQAAVELDPKKRAEMFIQMNDMLVEDVVMIPIILRAEVLGVDKTIDASTMKLTPWDRITWNIKDWRPNP